MKNKFICIIILICPFLYSNAQLNNFELSSYKLPDLERSALETNFILSSRNDNYRYPARPSIFLDSRKIASNNYNCNINVNYSHYLNKESLQRESSSGMNILYTFDNRKENKELDYETKYFNSYLYFSRENRRYFTPSHFFQIDLDLDYQYEKNKNSVGNTNSSNDIDDIDTHSLSLVVPLKIGKGRIEPIQDARHAIYIFEELSNVDRLPANINDDELIEFAEYISSLKNKRFFDSRLRKIEEIEAIDSFLIEKKYSKKTDARYYSILNDIWSYGNLPFRNSGTRVSLAIYPGFYLYDTFEKVEATYDNTYGNNAKTFGLDAGIEFMHEKPVNLYWQNSIGVNSYAGFINGDLKVIPNYESDIKIPYVQFELNHAIGYYPNTRTDISFGYSAKYLKMFDKTDDEKEILGLKGKAAKIETFLLINYYFSPRLRISAASNIFYIWQGSENSAFINLDNISKADYFRNDFITIINRYPVQTINRRIFNNTSVSLTYSIF